MGQRDNIPPRFQRMAQQQQQTVLGGKGPGPQMQQQQSLGSGPGGLGGGGLVSASPPLAGRHSWCFLSVAIRV